MSAISTLFEQALLSEATYANLVDNQGNVLTKKADVEAALRCYDPTGRTKLSC